MSNPGVIELVGFQLLPNTALRFCIEDNIGEAIHFHYANMRLDFTVKEFFALADNLLLAINELVAVDGFDAREFDPLFLLQIAGFLPHLQKVTIENIPLNKLLVETEKGVLPLAHSRVVKALKGNTAENDRFQQINMPGQSNNARLKAMLDSVKRHGYPYNGEHIILFNSQNYIRDGQHRASCLYTLTPKAVVPVKRLFFRDNMFNMEYDETAVFNEEELGDE